MITAGEGVLKTGITGLDDILGGGFPAGHLYLVEGTPGSGKTTLALQFLLEGVANNESVLYITLSETSSELSYVAKSHGWSLDGVRLLELSSFEKSLQPESQYTVFSTSDVELADTLKEIRNHVVETNPSRVVFDSLSEMRLLARDPLRFRRELLNLKQFFANRGATVLLLDDRTTMPEDLQMQSLTHGIVLLEQLATTYGAERRRLSVPKMRATRYRGGLHDFKIVTGGLVVFPRLIASEHRQRATTRALVSGVPNLDQLLGGGLDVGTSTLVLGPAGVGKSTIAILYAIAAAETGQTVNMYLFDENIGTVLTRCRGLGIPLEDHLESGKIRMRQIDPAEMSPGEFVWLLRTAVEDEGVNYLVIDSLNGLINAMPEESMLMIQLHEMLSYLSQMNVTSVLTTAQHGLLGHMITPADISYLADTVMLMRFFELQGEVHQAISILKKRTGPHERTIREMRMAPGGISVGPPLSEFEGVLTGVPKYVGNRTALMDRSSDVD